MASGPITSWQIDGETMKTVANVLFLGSTITVDDDYSHCPPESSLEANLNLHWKY